MACVVGLEPGPRLIVPTAFMLFMRFIVLLLAADSLSRTAGGPVRGSGEMGRPGTWLMLLLR